MILPRTQPWRPPSPTAPQHWAAAHQRLRRVLVALMLIIPSPVPILLACALWRTVLGWVLMPLLVLAMFAAAGLAVLLKCTLEPHARASNPVYVRAVGLRAATRAVGGVWAPPLALLLGGTAALALALSEVPLSQVPSHGGFGFGLALLLAAVPLVAAAAWLHRSMVRRALWAARQRLCPRCGYDLRGTTARPCPECGHPRPRPARLKAPRRRRRLPIRFLPPAPSSSPRTPGN